MEIQATGYTVGKVEASTKPLPTSCYRKVYGTGLYSARLVSLSWAASTRGCRDGLGNEWWEHQFGNVLTVGVVSGEVEAIKTKVGLECAAFDCPIVWEAAP
jgi:hypothetical protein